MTVASRISMRLHVVCAWPCSCGRVEEVNSNLATACSVVALCVSLSVKIGLQERDRSKHAQMNPLCVHATRPRVVHASCQRDDTHSILLGHLQCAKRLTAVHCTSSCDSRSSHTMHAHASFLLFDWVLDSWATGMQWASAWPNGMQCMALIVHAFEHGAVLRSTHTKFMHHFRRNCNCDGAWCP
jgi:hypothetical protein